MTDNNEQLKGVLSRYDRFVDKNLDKETLKKLYDDAAATYDQDVSSYSEGRKRFVKELTFELFGDNKSIKILDVGSGTGFAAKVLHSEGFKNIDAIDASQEMIKICKSNGIYNRTICDFVGPTRLDIEDKTYDFLMCLGSLLPTHINEDGFAEMIRITKPGGYIAFMVGVGSIGDGRTQIEECMQKLHDQGTWEWMINRIVEGYHIGTDVTEGLQYAFRRPATKT